MSKVMSSLWSRFSGLFEEEISKAELQSLLGTTSAMTAKVTILALLGIDRDLDLLTRLAEEHHWTVYLASSCSEAWDILNQRRPQIALCDRETAGPEWRDAVQTMSSAPFQMYTILLSRVADDNLWNEVIRRGGHDLIATPLREAEVLRAIRLGWSYWTSSMRMPPMLVKHYL